MALEKKEESAIKRKLVKFVSPLMEDVHIEEPTELPKTSTSKKKKTAKQKTAEEIKKDLQNRIVLSLLDKILYLETQGKSLDYAFNVTVASIGNINDYINKLDVATEELPEKEKHSIAILIISIILFIISVIPVIIDSTSFLGMIMSFILIILASLIFIYYHAPQMLNHVNKGKALLHNKKFEEEDVKKLIEKDPRFKMSIGLLWAVTVVAYFIISFWSADWHITWLVFLIGMSVDNIGRAIFEIRYSKRVKDEEDSNH